MGAHVIGVIRSASRLDALTYQASAPTDLAEPWKIVQICEQRPLAHGARPELWTAWHALESVTDWNDETLEHVLLILRETVPGLDIPGDLVALGSEVQAPPEPRATAANPRAFRGTKYRPPKPRRPEPVDVRQYFLTRRHTDHVMEQLGHPRGTDPYVAWNHGVAANTSLDPAFVMQLLPLFRGCTWGEVGAFAALARALELHAKPELRAALVGVYIAAEDHARALGWWAHVLAHDADQRLETAQLVSASGIATLSVVEPEFAAQIALLPAVQQWSVYRGLVGGASPAYVASGLQLGAIQSAKIAEVPPGRLDVTSVVLATKERLGKAMDEDSGSEFWHAHLWRLCGHQPELIDVLDSPDFISLRPQAAFWLLRIASTPRWEPEKAESRWRELARLLPLNVEFATRVAPEYQRKFVEDMGDVYWWAIDAEHSVVDAFAKCVDFWFRVAKPPFGTTPVLGELLPRMALVFSDGLESWHLRKAIADAPDSSWLAVEDACKRTNQARLLHTGFNRIGQFAPKLFVSSFATCPGALLQTADLIASISFEAAEALCEEYARSSLADPALADAPIERLCELIAPIIETGGPNPVRRALRLHLLGESPLSEAQIRGHRERILADLDLIRLAAIRQAVEKLLAARLGIQKLETPTVRHAAAMLNDVDVNRRPLRRMLTATLAGDLEWRLRHPRTTEWFARHPKVDRELWLNGIETTGIIDGVGEVRIGVEKDPLEALKLGTYVGSCLGRGGNLEYSAAAVVLDVNKQVVYARDARGAVVGRQLVAISEAEQLVCFWVYGTAEPDQLQSLFRDHDRALAARLGLPLFVDSDAGYEISSILSHSWFDDSAWEIGS